MADTRADHVSIVVGGESIQADVVVPRPARGVVAFAHGSGSGRLSPRNRMVAERLQEAGLGTVLADLLTNDEEAADLRTGEFRFDIELLSRRVAGVADWVEGFEPVAGRALGLFGASTGAAAALLAATARSEGVRTVVSRGGRPDLAGDHLRAVGQPVLLIVGERDEVVLDLNRAAMAELPGEARLEIVPGATHLFEEPGALDEVARLARDWFLEHL